MRLLASLATPYTALWLCALHVMYGSRVFLIGRHMEWINTEETFAVPSSCAFYETNIVSAYAPTNMVGKFSDSKSLMHSNMSKFHSFSRSLAL